MCDAGASGRELHISPVHSVELVRLAALLALGQHGVAMSQLSREYVSENLKVAMRMRGKPRVGLDSVLVQDSQRAELGECRIVPVREGEAVICVQPAMVAVAPGSGSMRRDLGLAKYRFGHVAGCLDHRRVLRQC